MQVCGRTSIIFNHLFFTLLFPLFVTGLIIIYVILFFTNGPSNVLFIQERMGRFGGSFKIYKFRTLVHGACINRFTHFLRHTGLDELPQLINIIKGEMLLFGPRPKLCHEISGIYKSDYQKHILKRHPGLLSLCMAEKGPGQSLNQTQDEMGKDIFMILVHDRYEQIHWSPKLMCIIIFCNLRKAIGNCMLIIRNKDRFCVK